jgi:hypothetical protein
VFCHETGCPNRGSTWIAGRGRRKRGGTKAIKALGFFALFVIGLLIITSYEMPATPTKPPENTDGVVLRALDLNSNSGCPYTKKLSGVRFQDIECLKESAAIYHDAEDIVTKEGLRTEAHVNADMHDDEVALKHRLEAFEAKYVKTERAQ